MRHILAGTVGYTTYFFKFQDTPLPRERERKREIWKLKIKTSPHMVNTKRLKKIETKL